MPLDRRTFLTRCGLSVGALAAAPKWLAAGLFNSPLSAADDNKLVVVQLAGGNDYLNSFDVPTAGQAYSVYRAARPRVGLNPAQTLRLDSQSGFHPSLEKLKGYFDSGKLAIVRGVGNEMADLSHFQEMERWHRADPTLQSSDGWLGRTLDFLYPTDTGGIRAVSISGDMPPSFESARGAVSSTVLVDAESFGFQGDPVYSGDDASLLQAFQSSLAPVGARNHDLAGKTASDALNHSQLIRNAFAAYRPAVTYPAGDFPKAFQLMVAVMKANLGPRIFHVMQDVDYDQHDTQLGTHATNLGALDRTLDAFQRDLQAQGLANRVVTLVWTEFGRRVEDNASGGTDHGSAGGLLLLGNRVRGGLHSTRPSLTELDDSGSLRPTVDFRWVYGTILKDWIGADMVPILGQQFPTLPIL